jgi:hypothetical protein
MRTTPPPRPVSPTPPPRPNHPRTRPAKGIDVPATVWLPPAESGSESALDEPGILPAWALRRLRAEYAEPGQPVVLYDSRAVCKGLSRATLRTLTEPHDPHPHTYPQRPGTVVRLAILEIDTEPCGTPTASCPDPTASLATDVLEPVLSEAADALEPDGILAIALAAPDVRHAVQHCPAVVRAARTAGFTYQQHIAVVTAEIDGDRLIPQLTDAQARTINRARAAGIPATAPAHLDLTIFTRTTKDTLA